MATETQTELQSFHEYVGAQLANGGTEITPEQALARWREHQATIASIQRGLDDVEAGRVKPAEEVLNKLGTRTKA